MLSFCQVDKTHLDSRDVYLFFRQMPCLTATDHRLEEVVWILTAVWWRMRTLTEACSKRRVIV